MFLLRTEDACLQFSADEIRGIYLLVSSDDGSGHIDIETRDGKMFKADFSRGATATDRYAFLAAYLSDGVDRVIDFTDIE